MTQNNFSLFYNFVGVYIYIHTP